MAVCNEMRVGVCEMNQEPKDLVEANVQVQYDDAVGCNNLIAWRVIVQMKVATVGKVTL